MATRETSEIAQRLAHVPLFEGLPVNTLLRIVSLAHARPLEAGESFFAEGDQSEAFLCDANRAESLDALFSCQAVVR